jgi:dihydroflavonol-4-reductase
VNRPPSGGYSDPVLITGAAGFIGTALARSLTGLGMKVHALVRPGRDASALESMGVAVVRGDATELADLCRAASGCGTVFHLAAERGRRKLSRAVYLERNTRGAVAAGHATLAVGAGRLVFTSAASVCGGSRVEHRNEATPAQPNSSYRESRLRAELALHRMFEERGLPVVIARLPVVLGLGAIEWLARFRAVRDGRIRFLPRGGVTHPGDVEDIVDGVRLAAEVPHIEGECFVLAGAESVPVRVLYAEMAAALRVPFSPRELPATPFLAYLALANAAYRATGLALPHGYTCETLAARISHDIGKARRVLGFSPRVSLRESVARTARWLTERQLL